MLSEDQKLQIKMSMNDKWYLVKLTHVWTDGHLINQMAHALIERNAELLSLREQLAELKALEPVGRVISCNGNKTLGWINDAPEGTLLFTATKLVDVDTIQDELIEQVGVMCDQATNIEEKNVYGHAYCVLKYGILPYLRKQGK